MSVRSLTTLAVTRDAGIPTRSTRKAKRSGARAAAVGDEASANADATSGEALVSAIPTEPLALYTGLVSAIVALFAEESDSTEVYLPLRWWIFGVGCIIVGLSVLGGYVKATRTVAKAEKRSVPVWELLAALLAFAVWGLVMPGSPLLVSLEGNVETITALCLTTGGVVVLYLMADYGLTKPAKKKKPDAEA